MKQRQPGYLPLAHESGRASQRHRDTCAISRRRLIVWVGAALCLASFLLIAYFHGPAIVEGVDVLWFPPNSYYGYHGSYLPFIPPPPASHSIKRPLLPVQDLPSSCLEDYFVTGAPCYDPVRRPMDVLWTWVNGSDLFLQQEKQAAEKRLGDHDPYRPIKKNQARQYRWVVFLSYFCA